MKKAGHSTPRQQIHSFQQIKNVGPAMERDFRRLKLQKPQELIGKDPFELYRRICQVDGEFHDPCVLDCYISAIEFMNGKPPQVWWSYTRARKKKYEQDVQRLRARYRDRSHV